jgi:hypothetical protein
MAVKSPKRALALLLLLAPVLLTWPKGSSACGPFFPRAVMVYQVHPDFPLAGFAKGQIGIIKPTYARSYLLVAYRYLAGVQLNPQEQKAVQSLWYDRLGYQIDSANSPPQDADPEHTAAPWNEARGKVPGVAAVEAGENYRSAGQGDSYNQYLNCTPDSYRTAALTLADRVRRFGADSGEIKDWVAAQDTVYSNCAAGDKTPSMAKSSFPAIIQADRAYQIAAASFYAGRFDDARKMFSDIAADPASPWKDLAPYLVARTLIRKATLSAEPGKTDMAVMGQAESQLIHVLADKRLQSIHEPAARLLNYVRFRLHPDERLRELASAVLKKNSEGALRQDLTDYTLLMDHYERADFDAIPEAAKKDDATDWIFTFQDGGQKSLAHAVTKWRETHSLPWLVAALEKTGAGDSSIPELAAAGRKVGEASPGFARVTFDLVRLAVQAGNGAEARALLDAALASQAARFPRSAINQLLSQRMYLASNLDEFLKFARRTPSSMSYDEDDREIPADPKEADGAGMKEGQALFDSDSVNVINQQMPLSVLKDVISNPSLPDHLKPEIATATWARAAILGDYAIVHQMAPVIQAARPEMTEALNGYESANTPEERSFAATFLMLKYPGVRPYITAGIGRQTPIEKLDEYRDNWWCTYNPHTWNNASNYYVVGREPDASDDKKAVAIQSPAFLTEAQRTSAAAQWKRLAALPTGPNYLCAQVMDYAAKKPADPRLAEALALAVRSTRYGCTDKETPKLSKAAFDLLHKRFPDTDWAKTTKYWYAN